MADQKTTRPAATVVPHSKVRSLRETLRKVRLGEAERADVVIDLQDTERVRLKMLAEELQDVFKEVPEDDDQFSFQIIPGSTPRLWIDVTSHIVVAGDLKTYRFLKDTRLGRLVILETADIDDMADCVTEYIAERIIERERALEGDWLDKRMKAAISGNSSRPAGASVWAPVALSFLVGSLAGAAGLIAFAWFAYPML
ncbi:hypothetical protein [Pannonibacter phragmitetus]|uniref:hypothetical protein n=1 Tax=Pannonibacter phragmitetus TaxID=121719 RepID=UPI003D2EEA82